MCGEISRDSGQLRGLSWSGGLHLSEPGGLPLFFLSPTLLFSSSCLSLSVQLDVKEPHSHPPPPSSPRPSPLLLSPPNPPIHPPTPGSRPVQPSHAWSSLGIHSGCFLFIASTLFSLSLSILYLSLHPVHPHHRLCVSSFTIRGKGTMPDLLCRHFLIHLPRLYMFSWHLYPQVAPDLK